MLIKIDPDRCQGHNLCVTYVAELVESDDEGFVTVIGDGDVPPELHERAKMAAANCPEYAITIESSESP